MKTENILEKEISYDATLTIISLVCIVAALVVQVITM